VTNSIGRLTGAIHVYGGDFFGVPHSEWDSQRLVEQPYDVQKTLQLFEQNKSPLRDSSTLLRRAAQVSAERRWWGRLPT